MLEVPYGNQLRFTHSFNRYILSTYYESGTVLVLGIQKQTKQTKSSVLKDLASKIQEQGGDLGEDCLSGSQMALC